MHENRTTAKTGPKPKPIAERFWPKVAKTETCWLWTGAAMKNGYGLIGAGSRRRNVLAHRAAWELAYGPVPTGLCVLHRCDVRQCVRPDHLFLGTRAENTADMKAKGRDPIGERHGSAKLTVAMVRDIRRYWAEGVPQYRIARHFGLNAHTVGDVVRRKTWAHVL